MTNPSREQGILPVINEVGMRGEQQSRQNNQIASKNLPLAIKKKGYKIIFKDNHQQELNLEAMEICDQLCLNPQTLKFKEFSDFAEPGVSQAI